MALSEYNRSLDQGRLVRDANLEVLEVFYPPHFEDIDDAGVGNSSPLKKGAICTVIHEGKTNIAVYQGDGEWLIVGDSTLKLGETADTAHRGDHGKAAYEHSQEEGNPHNTQIGDIDGLGSELAAKVKKDGDTMTGTLQLMAGSPTASPVKIPIGTLTTVPQAGSEESDGEKRYYTTNSGVRETYASVSYVNSLLPLIRVDIPSTSFTLSAKTDHTEGQLIEYFYYNQSAINPISFSGRKSLFEVVITVGRLSNVHISNRKFTVEVSCDNINYTTVSEIVINDALYATSSAAKVPLTLNAEFVKTHQGSLYSGVTATGTYIEVTSTGANTLIHRVVKTETTGINAPISTLYFRLKLSAIVTSVPASNNQQIDGNYTLVRFTDNL